MKVMQAVTGMKDLLPGEVRLVRSLEERARTLFETYAYREIRTPLLEFTELFRKTTGETTDIVEKEMYAFQDAGEKEIALRPEGTPSAVRALLEHGIAKQQSLVKWYYLGPMFRRERPQAGRYRQFTQIGAEAMGSASPSVDVELLEMLNRYFALVGLRGVELRLNSIGCSVCRPSYRRALLEFGRAHAQTLCGKCRARMERNPLRMLDCKETSCQNIYDGAPKMLDALCGECRRHFDAVQAGLKALGVSFVMAPKLVRGLDYYTRTAFEYVDPQLGAQNAVAGGGRYDDLIGSMGGDPLPAIGFAIGVERVKEGIEQRGGAAEPLPTAKVFFASLGQTALDRAMSLASILRCEGVAAELNFEPEKSLKAQLRRANQVGASFAVILGDQELAQRTVVVRDLINSVQEEVLMEDLASYMRKRC